MDREIRVRFAPSPTGPLHIGGVRTALYNYLFARQKNGKFILRIEDTDQSRYVPGAEQYIIDSLKWLGMDFDEGPGKEGPYTPYRQSERKNIYFSYAMMLVNQGHAYYAFDTPDELEAMRKEASPTPDSPAQYNYIVRKKMKNSLTLPSAEVNELISSGTPYVVRVKIPENEDVKLTDLIRGEVVVHSSLLDDKVLFKSDGMPTYHLANVVDDYLMKISHVIRGEEWLPSAPLHVLLYRFFGWEEQMPEFAHLPLLLKPEGNGKLSKRDGDRLGFPVFPLNWKDPFSGELSSGYREAGYLPEAVINILAFLGWNPGTEQEVFSIDELVSAFSLEKVHKAGARFDPEKARWFNHHYLQQKENIFLGDYLQSILKEKAISGQLPDPEKIVSLVKNRLNYLTDLWPQSHFFFELPVNYDEKMVKDKWKENTPEVLGNIIKLLDAMTDYSAPVLEHQFKLYFEQNQMPMGQVMPVLRLCLVGTNSGPGVFDIIEILGKEQTIVRIQRTIQQLGTGLNG